MSDIKVFDKLAADITLFVAPTMTITVADPGEAQSAIEVAQNLKAYSTMVEDKRKELVAPLNARVKAINDYCKQITLPLTNADTHVRAQLNAFATQQEQVRRAELARVEAERVEAERVARVAREADEEALRVKQEAEAEELAANAALFGVPNGDIDAANSEIDAQQTREWEEKQAELNRQEAVRKMEAQQAVFDANQVQLKTTRATWNVRVLDLALVPKEFLIITLNDRAALAIAKAGGKIAGLEFYETHAVAIGAKTRMPGVR